MRPGLALTVTAAVVLALAAPAEAAPAPGAASLQRSLTSGVTIGPHCAVSAFDGILANTTHTECFPAKLSASSAGVSIVSTAGQLADGDQKNALYDTFDARAGRFSVHARVRGPITQLTKDYQQVGVWFGPDTRNFVKVEAEHNSIGADPHVTMFWDENGTAGIVSTVTVPSLTTAPSVDFYVKAGAAHDLTAWYSLDGGTTQHRIGTTKVPADTARWFAATAKGGIVTSNAGSTSPVTATFSLFKIANL